MGVVYEAEDTHLKRRVALKFLPSHLAGNTIALDRFQHEARAASALNHPNICTIFDIDSWNGATFIAMELLEGVPLSEYLQKKPLQLQRITSIGIQVASALDAAARRSIVHRDIKPANIFVLTSGDCKILDFGIAKLAREHTHGTTETALTSVGHIVGTLAYMSPEQARGEDLDPRSDIFSLGVVLHEMAAGHPPSTAKSAAVMHDEILNRIPDPPSSHAGLNRIILKALDKDRELRYQTAADLRTDLKRLQSEPTSTAPALQHRRPFIPIAIVAGLIAITGVGAYRLGARRVSAPPQWTFTQLTHTPGFKFSPSLSPDAKTFLYSARGDIFLQRSGGSNSVNLTADSPAIDSDPAFSPDGDRIAFYSARDGGGVFVMGATGENPKRVASAGFHITWSPDGKRLAFSSEGMRNSVTQIPTQSRLYIVDLDSRTQRALGPNNALQPSWSPHRDRIAYFATRGGGAATDIWTLPVTGGDPVRVTNDEHVNLSPAWSPSGEWLYFTSDRAGTTNLWRVRIDEGSGRVLGTPEQITTPSSFSFMPSLSRDGRSIAYLQQSRTSNLQSVFFDPVAERTSTITPVTQGARLAWTPDLSPDGNWLVWASRGREDIFLVRPDGTGLRQLTDDSFSDRAPRWSPNGATIAFYSGRSGRRQVWTIRPDGSGLSQISDAETPVVYVVWSPDSRRIATGVGGEIHIYDALATRARGPVERIRIADGRQVLPWAWSPDGKALAFGSRTTTEYSGIFLYSFETGRSEQLTSFGWGAVWLNDNRRLLFTDKSRIYVGDRVTRKSKPVLSVAPQEIGWEMGLSKDNRRIFFNLDILESDVWLMTQN